jgi:hypothetical protein
MTNEHLRAELIQSNDLLALLGALGLSIQRTERSYSFQWRNDDPHGAFPTAGHAVQAAFIYAAQKIQQTSGESKNLDDQPFLRENDKG